MPASRPELGETIGQGLANAKSLVPATATLAAGKAGQDRMQVEGPGERRESGRSTGLGLAMRRNGRRESSDLTSTASAKGRPLRYTCYTRARHVCTVPGTSMAALLHATLSRAASVDRSPRDSLGHDRTRTAMTPVPPSPVAAGCRHKR